MTSKNNRGNSSFTFIGISVLLLLIIVALAYFYMQEMGAYNGLNSNYTNQQNQISALKSQLASNKTLYTNAENNLTNPYTEILFTDYSVSLPEYNETISNFTGSGVQNYYGEYSTYTATDNFTWGRLNYSFNAPYSGYLVFNSTSTLMNTGKACAWIVYETGKQPQYRNSTTTQITLSNTTYIYKDHFAGNDGLFANLTYAPWSELCPLQGVTYDIPVTKGENYLLIDNENETQGLTVTFSLKYIGYHSS